MSYPFYPPSGGYPAYPGQQPAYPPYGVQQQPFYANGYPYQQVPPPRPVPPPPINPAEAFRAFYQQQLSALTWNSRPIIQNLTILAQERRDRNDWASCASVASEIELAVDKAAPTAKLPLLYLIDSISKNIGAPYTSTYFPAMLAPTFLRAYSAVDGVTKTKMEEMLATWRKGGPGQTELFANGVREAVERGIYGATESDFTTDAYGAAPILTQASVLDQLARSLQSKRHILARDPSDPQAKLHLGVLEQIQKLLQTSALGQADLQSITNQLDTIAAAEAASSHGSTQTTHHQQHQQQQQYPSPPIHHQQPYPPINAVASGSTGSGTPSFQPAAIPSLPKIDFGGLFKNLAAAGIISHASTPTGLVGTPPGAGGGTPDGRSGREGSIESERSEMHGGGVGQAESIADDEDGLAEYEDLILSFNISLTLKDLETPHPFDPTAHLPNRCSQCSARFPAGKLGRSRLQAHLDWHFRRNRRERESEGRGGHRRWLPKAEFWIHDILANSTREDLEVHENATASGSGSRATTNPQQTAAAKAQRLAELTSQWVVMPADPTRAALPCPICKEKFVSEYNEAEEDWIWKNAVEVDGQIYHATCRADAMSSAVTNRILASEKNRASSASRDRSPGGPGRDNLVPNVTQMAPSPLKKKVESDDVHMPVAETVQEETMMVKQEPEESQENVAGRMEGERNEEKGDEMDSSPAVPAMTPNSLKRKAEEEVDAGKAVKREKEE